MLQFRATEPSKIKDPKCEVDCWVVPRQNLQGCTARYALYRLLTQGFRRCQGEQGVDVAFNGQRAHSREFYNGKSIWRVDGKLHYSPWGYHRVVDPSYGAFFWANPGGSDPLLDASGNVVWDTVAFWSTEEQQVQQDNQEDIYSAD